MDDVSIRGLGCGLKREKIAKLLPVFKAIADGHDVQFRLIGHAPYMGTEWIDFAATGPLNHDYVWVGDNDVDFRLKPPHPRATWVAILEGHAIGTSNDYGELRRKYGVQVEITRMSEPL